MNIFNYIGRFVFFVLIQTFLFNHIEVGVGIHIMVYPLFIFLLPYEMNVYLVLLLSFLTGATIDIFSDSFGLHASSLVFFAFLRSIFLPIFAPRDGYELGREMNVFQMGMNWFLRVFGALFFLFNLWFFLLEEFKLNEIFYLLQKTILSSLIGLILCILFQYLFINRADKERR